MARSSEDMISKNMIKPSTPTPKSLKTHQLSFLDQIQPPFYIPLVFFYQPQPNSDHAKISESLKKSLSQTLSHFYPLAGVLQHHSFVDCDDSGVVFIEARVHAPLSHFTANPKSEELRQLIPVDPSAHTGVTLVALKLSFFECGGFSVGVCCSHKIGDLASYMEFINAWATLCRGETLISVPSFDLALRFPPKAFVMDHHSGEKEKLTTKRLVFDGEMLERIRATSVCDEVKNPTRVEALSAFIWKMFIEAAKAKRGPERSSFAAVHAINLRPRSVPPVPDQTFGNCSVGKFTFTSKDGMSDLVSSLRAAFTTVDGDYVKNLINGVDKRNESIKNGTTDLCIFSSWWKFPMYSVDFGWGKPCWVCTAGVSHKNMVFLMGTPQGGGIEAWVHMPPDFSDIFETAYNNLLIT